MIRRAMQKIAVPEAKLVSQRSYIVAGKLNIKEHVFEVPKDYSRTESGTIKLFARSARKHETFPNEHKNQEQLPYMVYLQGGPGMPCKAPQHHPQTEFLVNKGYEVLYLDPRGTGLSTPITASTLQMRGDVDVQHRYLKLFRADNIVRDCEAIRKTLVKVAPAEKQKWNIMGQSFGGFCSLTYLSFYPEGLRESFIFGGLQPLITSPDEIYRRMYKHVQARNKVYYDKFPEDIERVKTILKFLSRFGDGKIKLPSEGSLTRRRFQQIGIMFGAHGGVDAVHDIVLKASTDIEMFGHLTRPTLSAIDAAVDFDDHLIYAILHEPIYCVGNAPRWSAERLKSEYPEFDVDRTDGPVYFTGEMVFSWMFEDYSELRKVAGVAEKIAQDSDWPELFDVEQLSKNEVPVYAASFIPDMYVDIDFARDTASKIRGCKVFETNVLFHNAIRARSEEVLKQVWALKEDTFE